MNIAQIVALRDEKGARIKEILEACKREGRNRTEAEETEYAKLVQERADLEAQAKEIETKQEQQQPKTPLTMEQVFIKADDMMRECRDSRQDLKIVLSKRAIMNTADIPEGTGILNVNEGEMLKPLRAGLIWDKLGIPVQSGLAGKLRWPLHTKATATWEGETSKLTDSSITFSKLEMNGKRLGIAIPVSRTELNDSEGIVERVVREEMPMACVDLINEAMFTLVAETMEGSNKVEKAVHGPFALKVSGSALTGCNIETIAASYADVRKVLLKAKAKVYGAGVQKKAPAFVMNEATKAVLEDTKVDAGSGRFLCENDMILGVPVFTNNTIPDEVIGFGDWSYQAAGFFGETSLIVDPYTLARQHSTDFVLNMRFGTATLRPEAFVLCMTAAAQTAVKTAIAAVE